MAFISSLLASSSQVHRKMYVCFSFRPAINDFEIVLTALGPQSYKGLAEIGVKNFILDGRPPISACGAARSPLSSRWGYQFPATLSFLQQNVTGLVLFGHDL